MSWQARIGVLLIVAVSTSGVGATESQALEEGDRWGTLSLYFENDLFSETDRNYTNGIRLSLVSPDLDSFQRRFIRNDQLQAAFAWLNPRLQLFHRWFLDEADSRNLNRRVVVSLGQTIYTPQTIDATELLTDERPYAGWLFLGVSYHVRGQDGARRDQLQSLGINLGIVGPWALGQEAQDLVHDIRGFDKFQGWDHQLENEPGLQLIYEKKRKWLSHANMDGLGYDLITHYGGSLGNIAIYANAGAEARWGVHIPDDFGTSALRPGGDNSAPESTRIQRLGVHLFFSTDVRLVAHDIFLDGNTFSSSHSVAKEHLVADAAVGVSVTYDQFKLSFAHIHRTREFKKQPSGHDYGSLSLSWNFNL